VAAMTSDCNEYRSPSQHLRDVRANLYFAGVQFTQEHTFSTPRTTNAVAFVTMMPPRFDKFCKWGVVGSVTKTVILKEIVLGDQWFILPKV
jgi:hypothetical protein